MLTIVEHVLLLGEPPRGLEGLAGRPEMLAREGGRLMQLRLVNNLRKHAVVEVPLVAGRTHQGAVQDRGNICHASMLSLARQKMGSRFQVIPNWVKLVQVDRRSPISAGDLFHACSTESGDRRA